MARSGSGLPAALVGGMFVFVSVMMGGERIQELRLGLASDDWPAVPGEVLRSSVTTRGGTRRVNRSSLSFSYRYGVNGAEYEGRRVAFTAIAYGRVPEVYPRGAQINVYYNPLDASVSVIEPGIAAKYVALSFLPLILFSALGLTLAGWGVRRSMS